MQWLEARNIRVDLVCHRVIRGAGPRASLTVIQYLSTVYRHVPQVACALIENGLDALARQGLTSLSLPLPIARTVSSPLYVQRSGANAATRPAL
jgi:hypothetical protein